MSEGPVSRLSLLRKQAGVRLDPEPGSGPSTQGRVEDTAPLSSLKLPDRALLRRLRPGLPPRAPTEQALPGVVVGDGLRLIERLIDAPAPPEAPLCARPEWARHPRTLVIDTETTGLSGGSGTMAFLIGALLWDGRQWRLLQWLLESPGAESLMLEQLQHCLRPDTRLLSYNGASFDLPLLRTRYLLNRKQDPFCCCSHTDLLHAVRRRYGQVWPDCRQITAELRLLDAEREDDLPGSEAPAAWQAWLRWRNRDALIQVIKHNERDVIRLGALLSAVDQSYRKLDFDDASQLPVMDWMLRTGQGAFLLQRLAEMPESLAARVLRRIRPGPGVAESLSALLDRGNGLGRLPVSRHQLCRAMVTRLEVRQDRSSVLPMRQPDLLDKGAGLDSAIPSSIAVEGLQHGF